MYFFEENLIVNKKKSSEVNVKEKLRLENNDKR